jgi:hypothetical protein
MDWEKGVLMNRLLTLMVAIFLTNSISGQISGVSW